MLRARLHDILSLDIVWLDDGHRVTGCALPADEEFTVERSDTDPIIEWARVTFADYVARSAPC